MVVELLPYQVGFIESFFSTDSVRHHLLTAPCGAGQFNLVVSLVERAVKTQNLNRVLLVVPGHLRDCYRDFLRSNIHMRHVESVDSGRYRELQAANPPWWRESIIAVVANHSEVLGQLAMFNWDLAVMQESADRGDSLCSHVQSLLNTDKLGRCVFLKVGDANSQFSVPSNVFYETVWKPEDIKGKEGHLLLILDKQLWKRWQYVRDPNEKQILSLLDSVVRHLRNNDWGMLIKNSLYQRAGSGISALEQASFILVRILALHFGYKLSDSLSAIGAPGEWSNEADPFIRAAGQVEAIWADGGLALEEIGDLCSWFDGIPGDNKLELLLENIESLFDAEGVEPKRVCIFSSFNKTASYLHSALSDEEYRIHIITDSTPFSERQQVFASLSVSDGILIATPQAVECLPPFHFTGVIHYDLPATQCELMLRFSGCKTPCPNYVIVDKSGVNKMEAHLLKSNEIPV